jgi:hypothetical protein
MQRNVSMDLQATLRRPLAITGSNGGAPSGAPVAAAAVAGAGAGGALMFLLDPDRSRRRHARERDTDTDVDHDAPESTAGSRSTVRDVRNRARGVVARTASAVRPGSVTSDRLEERVRAKMARRARHVGAVEVRAEDDRVTISGPVLRAEVAAIREAAHSVRGVGMVEDRLEVHEEPSDAPGLEGDGQTTDGPTPAEPRPPRWPGAVRVLAGAAGTGLAVYGLARRDRLGAGAGGAGVLLAVVAATNLGLARRNGND